VVAWGEAKDQAKAVLEPLNKLQETGQVTSIARNDNAIAALKADGSMIAWGMVEEAYRSTEVHDQLAAGMAKLQEIGIVTSVTRTDNAITALKADGSVVFWGDAGAGGSWNGGGWNASNLNDKMTEMAETMCSNQTSYEFMDRYADQAILPLLTQILRLRPDLKKVMKEHALIEQVLVPYREGILEIPRGKPRREFFDATYCHEIGSPFP